MGIISKIFNFNNIGQKIKNLTKWSCWITILLIWIAAAVMLVDGIAQGKELALLIPLAALVASIVVWIGSWTMYAFGELVEDIHSNRYASQIKTIDKKHPVVGCPDDSQSRRKNVP